MRGRGGKPGLDLEAASAAISLSLLTLGEQGIAGNSNPEPPTKASLNQRLGRGWLITVQPFDNSYPTLAKNNGETYPKPCGPVATPSL